MKIRVIFSDWFGEKRIIDLEPVGEIVYTTYFVKFLESGTDKPLHMIRKLRLIEFFEIR